MDQNILFLIGSLTVFAAGCVMLLLAMKKWNEAKKLSQSEAEQPKKDNSAELLAQLREEKRLGDEQFQAEIASLKEEHVRMAQQIAAMKDELEIKGDIAQLSEKRICVETLYNTEKMVDMLESLSSQLSRASGETEKMRKQSAENATSLRDALNAGLESLGRSLEQLSMPEEEAMEQPEDKTTEE